MSFCFNFHLKKKKKGQSHITQWTLFEVPKIVAGYFILVQ